MSDVPDVLGRERWRAARPLRYWISILVLGVGLALILATLLVIAHRLAVIDQQELERTAAAIRFQERQDAQTITAAELARTRYESEMAQLHRAEVRLNEMAAWYQEDVRLQLIQMKRRK